MPPGPVHALAQQPPLLCRCADEQKFAVGSGAKTLAVCNHDEANNFWVSKQMKVHTSSVVAVAWDPSSSVIIATACTDYKCRVFSAYMKAVDGKAVETRWGANPKFGTLFFEISSLGWVRRTSVSHIAPSVSVHHSPPRPPLTALLPRLAAAAAGARRLLRRDGLDARLLLPKLHRLVRGRCAARSALLACYSCCHRCWQNSLPLVRAPLTSFLCRLRSRRRRADDTGHSLV